MSTVPKKCKEFAGFYRTFIDFPRASELCKTTNKYADANLVGSPAYCKIPKKITSNL